ncbi:hypothetical protein B0T10DRAFT_302146 [Thelonectria olida]|uniref:Uncharacterized protein n=1 Tax=Thelonectria olida TaxID=1576542 RepID=A0A9P8W8J4_9HYPO|nr:hypothetical protein B0T10DRAFT_302146 [Thelonectria olida]
MMATQQDFSRRPRLSLQIKTSCSPVTKSTRSYAVDPRDPTAFNTLSNVYVTTIQRSTPIQAEPLTAINSFQSFPSSASVECVPKDLKNRVVTPYVASYPETPLSATATSPQPMEISFPSVMTATPPLSAGLVDPNGPKVFSFCADDISAKALQSPSRSEPHKPINRPMPRLTSLGQQPPPYIHPQSLHSILRNSPLPPPTAIQLSSSRRQSLRLQEKAAKRVGYNNPLTQDIVNNMYTKSHIDLLVEEASPRSPPIEMMQPQASLDLALAFNPNEIEDGGQTPGPFEDMRRRMTSLTSGAPTSPGSSPGGIRKRKKKEKKRRWVWTIGQDEDDDEHAGGSVMALRTETAKAMPQKEASEKDRPVIPLLKVPLQRPKVSKVPYIEEVLTPSIESTGSESESQDVYMSDSSSCISHTENRGLTPNDMDVDTSTPTVPPGKQQPYEPKRVTPIPPEMM